MIGNTHIPSNGLLHALADNRQSINGNLVSRLARGDGEASYHKISEISESYALLSNVNILISEKGPHDFNEAD